MAEAEKFWNFDRGLDVTCSGLDARSGLKIVFRGFVVDTLHREEPNERCENQND
jgi:hypothetical protein